MCVAGRCLVRKDGVHVCTVSSVIITTTHQTGGGGYLSPARPGEQSQEVDGKGAPLRRIRASPRLAGLREKRILTCGAKIKGHGGRSGPGRPRLRCEVVSGFRGPLPHSLSSRALAVTGSWAPAGVQMAVESVGVTIPPATSSRGTSLTAGALWVIRRSCGFRPEPPGSRSPSSGPAPTTWVSSRGSAVSRFCPPHPGAA